MLKMVDGTGIIGVDMVCPLGGTVSPPQPPNYDNIEMEGVGSLVLPNSLKAPIERVELLGGTEQLTTTGKNLLNIPFIDGSVRETPIQCNFEKPILIHAETLPKSIQSNVWRIKVVYKDNTLKYVVDSDMQKGSLFDASPENPIVSINYRGLYITEGQYEKIQVEYGAKVTPYEPYTGGKPSPSPEYPQEIKSAGKWNEGTQKYEIDVTVNNSGYLQKGSYYERIRLLRLEKGKTYRLYVPNKSEIVNAFILNEEKTFTNGGTLYNYGHGTKKLTVPNKTGVISGECMLQQMLNPGYVFTVTVDGLFLYQGVNHPSYDTDSAYITYDVIKTVNGDEPYTEQALTLTSDRPITKWDKLVEQGGEIGWLYQSVIDSNVKPSRGDLFPNGFSLFKDFGNGVYVYKVTNIKKAIGFQTSLCEQFKNKDGSYSTGDLFCYSDQPSMQMQYFVTDIPTLEEFKTWMETNPLTMVYQTVESQFIPLSESEQTQLRNLHSYNGTTNITVDSGEVPCGIKLTYRKEI